GSRTSEGTSETTGLKKGRTSEALSLAKSTAAPDSSRTTLVAGELALSLSVAENRKNLFSLDWITSSDECTRTGCVMPDFSDIAFSAARLRASISDPFMLVSPQVGVASSSADQCSR